MTNIISIYCNLDKGENHIAKRTCVYFNANSWDRECSLYVKFSCLWSQNGWGGDNLKKLYS